jgi:putative copper export protein
MVLEWTVILVVALMVDIGVAVFAAKRMDRPRAPRFLSVVPATLALSGLASLALFLYGARVAWRGLHEATSHRMSDVASGAQMMSIAAVGALIFAVLGAIVVALVSRRRKPR